MFTPGNTNNKHYAGKIKRNTSQYSNVILTKTNITKLNTKLKNANWARVNPDLHMKIFIETLNSHIDEYLPWKKIKVNTETNEWLIQGILTLRKEKKLPIKL